MPEMRSRIELHLARLAGEDVTPPAPQCRIEEQLDDIYLHGVRAKMVRQIAEELPETGDPCVIYMIPNESDDSWNSYDEYVWIENLLQFELIGGSGGGGGSSGVTIQRITNIDLDNICV